MGIGAKSARAWIAVEISYVVRRFLYPNPFQLAQAFSHLLIEEILHKRYVAELSIGCCGSITGSFVNQSLLWTKALGCDTFQINNVKCNRICF